MGRDVRRHGETRTYVSISFMGRDVRRHKAKEVVLATSKTKQQWVKNHQRKQQVRGRDASRRISRKMIRVEHEKWRERTHGGGSNQSTYADALVALINGIATRLSCVYLDLEIFTPKSATYCDFHSKWPPPTPKKDVNTCDFMNIDLIYRHGWSCCRVPSRREYITFIFIHLKYNMKK
jgi:hypothetical protein